LLAAAAELPSKTGLRPRTFVTLFGLYAVTGLRCREPLQLDRTDVDWQNGALTIRGTKFGKSRLVPLHPSTVDALRVYGVCRDRLCRNPDSPSFFLSEAGTRLSHWAVRATFVTLSHRIGLRRPNDSHGPRVHDLRHRMAVNTLLQWYRECRCRTAPADALDLSRPCAHHRHLLVSDRHAGVIAASHAAARTTRLGGAPMKPAGAFPALLEAFFVDRLMRQRQVSRHTLASYRDTFRLLLEHAQEQLGKVPSALTLADLDAPFVGRFLDHLEQGRGNTARSRNVRLAAIHSFFHYVALHAPEHSALASRVLAMPSKRYLRRPIDFLTPAEVAALLAAPDLSTWAGRHSSRAEAYPGHGFASPRHRPFGDCSLARS
jgi:site-specific recombinase XerD